MRDIVQNKFMVNSVDILLTIYYSLPLYFCFSLFTNNYSLSFSLPLYLRALFPSVWDFGNLLLYVITENRQFLEIFFNIFPLKMEKPGNRGYAKVLNGIFFQSDDSSQLCYGVTTFPRPLRERAG